VADLPYVLLSCCVSLDGYLDSPTGPRLVLSNDADLDRIDRLRAASDAIMVGAGTVRSDDPRLFVRSPDLQAERLDRGLDPSPIKVTVTASGRLDPGSRFFTTGTARRLVYSAGRAVAGLRASVPEGAEVVDVGSAPSMAEIARDLSDRGVNRLMVEGGGRLHTQFLTAGLADELRVAVAPIFVGDARAPRFVLDGDYPWAAGCRAPLAGVEQVGDVVVMRYALSPRFAEDEFASAEAAAR
jgi:5-amino-6-(5-phosphoribosylamino)uracil reductase